jgi:hypothetical protein
MTPLGQPVPVLSTFQIYYHISLILQSDHGAVGLCGFSNFQVPTFTDEIEFGFSFKLK